MGDWESFRGQYVVYFIITKELYYPSHGRLILSHVCCNVTLDENMFTEAFASTINMI